MVAIPGQVVSDLLFRQRTAIAQDQDPQDLAPQPPTVISAPASPTRQDGVSCIILKRMCSPE